jgi:hypothetical protein
MKHPTCCILALILSVVPAKTQTLQNQAVRMDFDLGSGTYSLGMPAVAGAAIRAARATVEGWSSADAGYQRRIAEQTKERMLIECSRADAPTLMLEFTLHPAFVELRTGLQNTTGAPLRIKKYWPLAGGVPFSGEPWTDVRTLDAPAGSNQPSVTANAVRSSANNLLVTFKQAGKRRSLVLGALKTADFTKWAHTTPTAVTDGRNFSQDVTVGLEAYDPIGRLVDPGETYLPADSFYVDIGTANSFEALEKYGLALREATGAKPNVYDFPTVCAWYAGVWKTAGAQDHPDKSTYKINTSSGMVEEAQKIKSSGFLNYSRAAVRLVPDTYAEYNPQGWWDDAHWQKHGYYTAPYATSENLGQGMHDAGCLAFTYIQPRIQPPQFGNKISRDFREAHPAWLLNKERGVNLDFSLPQVRDYVRARFDSLRGNIDGFMVDYCDELWMSTLYGQAPEERLGKTPWESIGQAGPVVRPADPKMTACEMYRAFFTSLRHGIGPDARIHERSLTQPNNELTLGLVDSYRTAQDTDKITPDLVSRSGLRWYKNRVVIAYDMDSKELTSAWKVAGWTGTDQDGRRMLLTMAYVAASRLLLANSFRDLKPEVLYDLERTFPYPSEPRSARPVDAFTHAGWPRVYDFAVTPDWHQVTLFNNTLPTREEILAVPLAGDTADGALGLDPGQDYYIYDFWNDCFAGKLRGTDTLQQTLRPGEARMLSIRKVESNPQVLSTNRHLMQGQFDLTDVQWDGRRLSGKAKVVAGEPFKIVIALNGREPGNLQPSADGQLAVLTLRQATNQTVEWSVDLSHMQKNDVE